MVRAVALEVASQNFEIVECLEVSWFTQLEGGETERGKGDECERNTVLRIYQAQLHSTLLCITVSRDN